MLMDLFSAAYDAFGQKISLQNTSNNHLSIRKLVKNTSVDAFPYIGSIKKASVASDKLESSLVSGITIQAKVCVYIACLNIPAVLSVPET